MTKAHRTPGAVVVCADRSAAAHHALRWGVAEAGRRKAPLYVVACGERASEPPNSVVADAIAAVRTSISGLPILGGHPHGPVLDTLRELSADAAARRRPGHPARAARRRRRVLLPGGQPCRNRPARSGASTGPVVLGAAPWTDGGGFRTGLPRGRGTPGGTGRGPYLVRSADRHRLAAARAAEALGPDRGPRAAGVGARALALDRHPPRGPHRDHGRAGPGHRASCSPSATVPSCWSSAARRGARCSA